MVRMSCATLQKFPTSYHHNNDTIISGSGSPLPLSPILMSPTNTNETSNQRRTRKVSSSALYQVHRKDSNDVFEFFVPDEYDLVKSHLMFAVREEVEVLKEKIAELMERINHLETENNILRANASEETLSQLKGPGGNNGGGSGNNGGGGSNNPPNNNNPSL